MGRADHAGPEDRPTTAAASTAWTRRPARPTSPSTYLLHNGVTAGFSMEAFSSYEGRRTRIMGSAWATSWATVESFDAPTSSRAASAELEPEDQRPRRRRPPHGGRLGGQAWGSRTAAASSSIEASVESHLIAFAAEKSRRSRTIETVQVRGRMQQVQSAVAAQRRPVHERGAPARRPAVERRDGQVLLDVRARWRPFDLRSMRPKSPRRRCACCTPSAPRCGPAGRRAAKENCSSRSSAISPGAGTAGHWAGGRVRALAASDQRADC